MRPMRSYLPNSVANLMVFSLLLCCLTGCRPSAKSTLKSNNQMKQLLIAITNYHDSYHGWPESLADIRPFTEMDNFEELMLNPVTGENPGYEYVQPSPDSDPETTVLLYQLRDGQRDLNLEVCFADISVRKLSN